MRGETCTPTPAAGLLRAALSPCLLTPAVGGPQRKEPLCDVPLRSSANPKGISVTVSKPPASELIERTLALAREAVREGAPPVEFYPTEIMVRRSREDAEPPSLVSPGMALCVAGDPPAGWARGLEETCARGFLPTAASAK